MAQLHLALSETHELLLERLMDVCDLKTKKDVIENALVLLGWAATEAAKGNEIASVDESRKLYREIKTPALQSARMKAEMQELRITAKQRALATTAG